jgi:hypothetical protein
MENKIIDVFTRPASFFGSRVQNPQSMKLPLVIVFVGAVISGIMGYQLGTLTAQIFAQASPGLAGIISITTLISSFVVFLVIWPVMTAVFYLVSMVFRGKGTFGRLLEFVGIGSFPQVISAIVTLLVAQIYLPLIRIPHITNIQDPAAILAATKALTTDPAFREFTLVSLVVSIIFLIWSANLWIFGVKEVRGLTTKQAAITVLVPVLAYILINIAVSFGNIANLGGV